MATPSSFLIGGAPQQNFDYMAVANHRVRTMDAMTRAIGAAASIGTDIYTARVTKKVNEYSQMYRSDILKWAKDTEGQYRTAEEYSQAFTEFSIATGDRYKLAIGDRTGQELFDNDISPLHHKYATDTYIKGKVYEAEDTLKDVSIMIGTAKQNIYSAQPEHKLEITIHEQAAAMARLDELFANKQISEENYNSSKAEASKLLLTGIEEIIKYSPLEAHPIIETFKGSMDLGTYRKLLSDADFMVKRTEGKTNAARTTSITAAIEEALNNGRSGVFSSEERIANTVANIKDHYKHDPITRDKRLEEFENSFALNSVKEGVKRATGEQLLVALNDSLFYEERGTAFKEKHIDIINKELQLRQNHPIRAAMRAPSVQKAYDEMVNVRNKAAEAYGVSEKWTEEARAAYSASVSAFMKELIDEQKRLGVPESSIQVFSSEAVALYQQQLNHPNVTDTQIYTIISELARMTQDEEALSIGIAQIEPGDPSARLALAAIFSVWDETTKDIRPINPSALTHILSASTMPWPDSFTNQSTQEREKQRLDISAKIRSFLDTAPEQSRDGLTSMATKVYALEIERNGGDAKTALKRIEDIFINSAFIKIEEEGKAEHLYPNKILVKDGDNMIQVNTNPQAIRKTQDILRLVPLDQIDPQEVIKVIEARDLGVEFAENDRDYYKGELEGAISRANWVREGEKMTLYYTDNFNNNKEVVKFLGDREATISLQKIHSLYALAEAESITSPRGYKFSATHDVFKKKLYEELGLIYDDSDKPFHFPGATVTF